MFKIFSNLNPVLNLFFKNEKEGVGLFMNCWANKSMVNMEIQS